MKRIDQHIDLLKYNILLYDNNKHLTNLISNPVVAIYFSKSICIFCPSSVKRELWVFVPHKDIPIVQNAWDGDGAKKWDPNVVR